MADDTLQLVFFAIVAGLVALTAAATAFWRYWRKLGPRARQVVGVLLLLSLPCIAYGWRVQHAQWVLWLGLIIGALPIGVHIIWVFVNRTGKPEGLERLPEPLEMLDDLTESVAEPAFRERIKNEPEKPAG